MSSENEGEKLAVGSVQTGLDGEWVAEDHDEMGKDVNVGLVL